MNLLRSLVLSLFAIFSGAVCLAQGAVEEKPEMATGMRADGKIYVVIAIVLTILFILLAYLAVVDRKIKRLEQGNNK